MRIRLRILEWTFWLALTAFLGAVSLLAASFLIPRSESFLSVGRSFYAFLRPAWIDLASDLDSDSGSPAPEIVNPRNIVQPPVKRSSSVNLPGFSLTFCLFHTIPALWSARISLFVPVVLSLFSVAFVYYRLTRLKSREKPAAPTPSL
jgi:hypothetical protein